MKNLRFLDLVTEIKYLSLFEKLPILMTDEPYGNIEKSVHKHNI